MTSSKVPENNPVDDSAADQVWVKDALQTYLDSEVKNLDFVVSSKLEASRRQAISQDSMMAAHKKKAFTWIPSPALAGSAAVVALALVLGQQLMYDDSADSTSPQDQSVMSKTDLMRDVNILSANDDIEFFQSMDFLEWMDNNSG